MSDPEVMVPAGTETLSTLEKAMTQFNRDCRSEGCFAIVLKETGRSSGASSSRTTCAVSMCTPCPWATSCGRTSGAMAT